MARGELLRVRYASEAVDAAIAVAYAAAAAVSAVRPHRREDQLGVHLLEDLLLQGVHGEFDPKGSAGNPLLSSVG